MKPIELKPRVQYLPMSILLVRHEADREGLYQHFEFPYLALPTEGVLRTIRQGRMNMRLRYRVMEELRRRELP